LIQVTVELVEQNAKKNNTNTSQTTFCTANGNCTWVDCSAGTADCDNTPANGCEIKTSSDTSNCGACGHVCSFPNAASTCTSGVCGLGTCNANYADCDGNKTNGCETYISNIFNCGSCGNPCNASNANNLCTSGTCSVSSCKAGYADCDHSSSNGCEVNIYNSTSNCGACNNACSLANAVPACTGAGVCTIANCKAGYADCDMSPTNGCEKNLNTDSANCGSCFNICTGTLTCKSGTCA